MLLLLVLLNCFLQLTYSHSQHFPQSNISVFHQFLKTISSYQEDTLQGFSNVLQPIITSDLRYEQPFIQSKPLKRRRLDIIEIPELILPDEYKVNYTSSFNEYVLTQNTDGESGKIKVYSIGPCHPRSTKVLARSTVFYCGGQKLNYTQFNQTTNNGDPELFKLLNCKRRHRYYEACFCPADLRGRNCQLENPIKCSFIYPTRQMLYENCQEGRYKQAGYNPDFDGDPPCFTIGPDSNSILQLRINCENEFLDKLKEDIWGIEPPYEIVWKYFYSNSGTLLPKPFEDQDISFNYTYRKRYGNNFKSSFQREFYIRVAAINWDKISQSVYIDYNDSYLPTNLVQGQKSFPLQIHFNKIAPFGTAVLGRYSIQIQVFEKINMVTMLGEDKEIDRDASGNQFYIIYEQAGYEEPAAQEKFKRWIPAVIVIVILLIIGIVVGLVYVIFKRRHKNSFMRIESVELREQNSQLEQPKSSFIETSPIK